MNIKEQVGCGYCIHEKSCKERDSSINKAKLGCERFLNYLEFVEKKDFYSHDSPEQDARTKLRLLSISKCGMEEVGIGEFGYPGIMSGLYIERVWSYSDKDFDDYMQWAKELIAHKQQEGGSNAVK